MKACLGIGSYTLPWAVGVPGFPKPARSLGPFELLAEARRLGAKVVQICDNLPLNGLPGPELSRLRSEAVDAGVGLEVGTRGTEAELLAAYLSIAEAVGSRVLRTLVSVDPSGRARVAEAERTVRGLLPELASRGITLLVENYEHVPAAGLRGLVDRIGSDYVRVCLDTVNNLGIPEDQERVLDALCPVAGGLHVKDFRIRRADHGLGYVIEGAPAGEGRLDIAGLLDRVGLRSGADTGAGAAGQRDRSLSAVIELWTPWQGSLDETVALEQTWAERSMANMRRILA